jgi:hypothetical protein
MKFAILVLAASLVLAGCGVSGHYRSEGPCRGFHKDQQACERAHENSLVIGKVQIGQTLSEVSAIMGGKAPDAREATPEFESWSYLTRYQRPLSTVIIFKRGMVTEIRQSASARR